MTHLNALERMIFFEMTLVSDMPLNMADRPRFF